jgi:hypothetical protein
LPQIGVFVHADGHHVELTALGGNVGGDALAQHAFLQRDPLELDVRVGGLKVLAELLHLDHVAVVHGGNHEFGVGVGQASAEQRGGEGGGEAKFHGCLLLGACCHATVILDRGGILV